MDYKSICIALVTAIVVYVCCKIMYHIGYMARVHEEKVARGIN